MHPSAYHFLPYPSLLLALFAILLAAAVALVELGLLQYAYEKMGIGRRQVFGLLLLCLLGSYINIPIAELPDEPVQSAVVVRRYGMVYITPTVKQWPHTVLAVNLGGAIVPTAIALYLLAKNELYLLSLVSVALVAGSFMRWPSPSAEWGSRSRF